MTRLQHQTGSWTPTAGRAFRLMLLTLVLGASASAASIQIADSLLFVHDSSGLITTLDSSSPSYFSTLDALNEGTFGWTFSNSGAVPLTDVRLLAFLDADLDRDDNTFFNEYGEFVSLALPPGAPVGAIAASGWEIDEPGFLFGDILINLSAGVVDNSNGVPSSFPDDVSLALLFSIGSLDPGRTATLTMTISPTSINGFGQVDADSASEFYWNGYAEVDLSPPVNPVPEPATGTLLFLSGVAAVLARRRRKI